MTVKIKGLPISERPYEKLEMYGEDTLSNAELLAIIIKTGTKDENSLSLAQKILSMNNKNSDNLKFIQDMSIEDFMSIKGIGRVKAIQLKAVCELAKRISRPINNLNVHIEKIKDVTNLLMDELRNEKKEVVKLILLNNKNVLIKIRDICLGTDNLAILKPKDVLVEAIKAGAPKIILVHNHPSGDPTPSERDIELTKELVKSSSMMGIKFLDHIIIGNSKYESIFLNTLKNEKAERKSGEHEII